MNAPRSLGMARIDAFRTPVQHKRTKRTIMDPARRAAMQPSRCVSIKPQVVK